MGDESNLDDAHVSYVSNIAFELFKLMSHRIGDFGPHPVTDEDQQLTLSGVAVLLKPDAPVTIELELYSGLIDRKLVMKLHGFPPGAYPPFLADNVGDEVFAHLDSIYGVPLVDLGDGGRIVLDLPTGTAYPEEQAPS